MRTTIIAPLFAVAFAILCGITLYGCGQMGPLYMPPAEETSQDKATKPVNQPTNPPASQPADQPQQQTEES